eukprot:2837785-Amphidinium_carterae.1
MNKTVQILVWTVAGRAPNCSDPTTTRDRLQGLSKMGDFKTFHGFLDTHETTQTELVPSRRK